MLALALGLSVVPPALAHFPHDVAGWVATEDGHVTTSVWRTEFWLAADTVDGRSFTHRYLLPGDVAVSSAAWVDGVLWLGTDIGLWFDDGSVQLGIPEAAVTDVVARDGSVVVSTDQGVYVDGALISSVSAVDLSDDGWWALGDDGSVISLADGLEHGGTGDHPSRIDVTPDGRILLSSPTGLLLSTDGANFLRTDMTEDVVLVDALTDDVWLAAGPNRVYRTEDAGANWDVVDGLETPMDGSGGPLTGEHYLETETAPDGRLYLASWEGLCVSDDLGATWTQWGAETPRTIRGVSWARSDSGASWIAAATYGAGASVYRTDGTDVSAWATWEYPYERAITLSDAFDTDGRVWAYGNSTLRLSDGDQTVGAEVGEPEQAAPLPGGGLLIGGRAVPSTGSGSVAVSSDGASFTVAEIVGDCTATVSAVAAGADGTLYAGCQDGQVLRSTDGGATFLQVATLGSSITDLAAPVGSRPLTIATHDGLWAYADAAPTRAGLDGEYVYRVATAESVLLASSFDTGLWRDDGAGLAPMTAPTAEVVTGLALSPDYGVDHGIALATYAGLWLSLDDGATWAQSLPWERYPDSDPAVVSSWTTSDVEFATDGRARVGSDPASPLTFSFYGQGAGLYAVRQPTGALATVAVDGQAAVEVDLSGASVTDDRVWFSGALADGWHDLAVTPVAGDVVVDGFQVWLTAPDEGDADTDVDSDTDTDPPDSDSDSASDSDSSDSCTPESRGCRCAAAGGDDGAAWVALAGALALVRRRPVADATRAGIQNPQSKGPPRLTARPNSATMDG